MRNWKTTLGGILIAVGGPLATAGEGWVGMMGMGLTSAGALLLGGAAKDSGSPGR